MPRERRRASLPRATASAAARFRGSHDRASAHRSGLQYAALLSARRQGSTTRLHSRDMTCGRSRSAGDDGACVKTRPTFAEGKSAMHKKLRSRALRGIPELDSRRARRVATGAVEAPARERPLVRNAPRANCGRSKTLAVAGAPGQPISADDVLPWLEPGRTSRRLEIATDASRPRGTRFRTPRDRPTWGEALQILEGCALSVARICALAFEASSVARVSSMNHCRTERGPKASHDHLTALEQAIPIIEAVVAADSDAPRFVRRTVGS